MQRCTKLAAPRVHPDWPEGGKEMLGLKGATRRGMATRAHDGSMIDESTRADASSSTSSSSPANLRSEEIRSLQLAARHHALARQAAAEAADWERECFNIMRVPTMAANLLPAQDAAKEARAAAERELAMAAQYKQAARKCHRQAEEDDFFAQMRAEAAEAAKATAEDDANKAAAAEAKLKAKQLEKIQKRERQREQQEKQREQQRAHWAKLEAQRATVAAGGTVEAAEAEAVPSVAAVSLEAEVLARGPKEEEEEEPAANKGPARAAVLTAAAVRSRGEAAVEQMLADARSGALKLGQRLGLRLTDSKHGGFQVEPLAVFAPLATAWGRLSKDAHEERERERAEATAEEMMQSLLSEDARLANRANLLAARGSRRASARAGIK